MKKVSNKIMLITYADCMGHDLKDLNTVLDKYLDGAVYGLHILPFFPSSADRGFAPTTYDIVDPQFGDWDDMKKLSEKYYLMYDYMINHISAHSEIYHDFLEKKDASEYRDFFIRFKDFWKNGEPTEEQISKIYLRKEQPYIEAEFADGTKEKLWCTFSPEQIDINCLGSEKAKEYLEEKLKFLSDHGASLIRLDALAYASKREDTNCFFVEPEIWKIVDQCEKALEGTDSEILPEIHENYFIQKKLEEKNVYTYDFQLPMLILNAVYFGRTLYLKDWMKLCPRKQFTTLDTHDGIGVVDVRYLMPDEEVLATKKKVFDANPDITEVHTHGNTKVNFSKFDTYQICCTYYDALGSEDERYLIARAVQFFAPGIPQVYYVGLFAGRNDWDFYRETRQPRDINRHYYGMDEIEEEFKRPVVQKMNRLMKLRNSHPAFDGEFVLLDTDEHTLGLRWEKDEEYAQLVVDFETLTYEIDYSENGENIKFK